MINLFIVGLLIFSFGLNLAILCLQFNAIYYYKLRNVV
jgi:hypothetical protein